MTTMAEDRKMRQSGQVVAPKVARKNRNPRRISGRKYDLIAHRIGEQKVVPNLSKSDAAAMKIQLMRQGFYRVDTIEVKTRVLDENGKRTDLQFANSWERAEDFKPSFLGRNRPSYVPEMSPEMAKRSRDKNFVMMDKYIGRVSLTQERWDRFMHGTDPKPDVRDYYSRANSTTGSGVREVRNIR